MEHAEVCGTMLDQFASVLSMDISSLKQPMMQCFVT